MTLVRLTPVEDLWQKQADTAAKGISGHDHNLDHSRLWEALIYLSRKVKMLEDDYFKEEE